MPTKSSYQRRPRCSTGSTACAAIASAISSVIAEPLGAVELLVGQELRGQLAQPIGRQPPCGWRRKG